MVIYDINKYMSQRLKIPAKIIVPVFIFLIILSSIIIFLLVTNKKTSTNQIVETNQVAVPKDPPTGYDYISTFFQNISENNIPIALFFVDPSITEKSKEKTLWETVFSNLKNTQIKTIKAYNQDTWPNELEYYEVQLTTEKQIKSFVSLNKGDNTIIVSIKKYPSTMKVISIENIK